MSDMNLIDELFPGRVPVPEPDTRTVVQRLHAIMLEVSVVGKGGENTQQGFSFRGIDQLEDNLGPMFRRHGVVTATRCVSRETGRYEPLAGKGPVYFAAVTMAYVFTGLLGDELTVEMPGAALDSYDKATTKALSQALKYALSQAFQLPTGGPDPDEDNPGQGDGGRARPARKASKSAPQQNRAKAAPPELVDAPTAAALLAAMNDPVTEEQRAKLKSDFLKKFGRPAEVQAVALRRAWAFLKSQLEVEEHDYVDGGGLCSLCGVPPGFAPWCASDAVPSSGGSGGEPPPDGPDGPPTGHTAAVAGGLPDDFSPEWVSGASKSDLQAALAGMGQPTGGTLPELRERLLAAVEPM